LWAQGKADAAIEREQLCDELAKVYDLDIWCGCLSEGNDREQRIYAEHSAVYSR
jgi:hypothetical protein